jgi:hypothetical protein
MAQFVLVVGTLVGIYRQLAIARGASAFDEMSRIAAEILSERMTRCRLDVLLALQDEGAADSLPEGSASYIADYWENVAALCRSGHVDRKLVREHLGSSCRWWWAVLEPFTRRARMDNGDQTIGEHHEWLAGEMAAIDEKVGVQIAYDAAFIANGLKGRIQRCRDDITILEELRAVIVRPMVEVEPPPAQTEARA